MKDDNQFQFTKSVFTWPFYFVLLLWVIYWVEVKFHIYLTEYGILPRTASGLKGILFSPFLHGSLEHIYNNSIPLFLLVAAMRYFYRRQALQVMVFGILLSGFITWVIGRGNSYHIGASGLIYVLVSFIFFKGIQTKYYRLTALSLLIIMLYGSMIWYVFPGVEDGISWEGHLGGLISGYLFSRLYDIPEYKKKPFYAWEKPDFDPQQDAFMKRFDENGNFVNPPKPEPEIPDDDGGTPAVKIIYNYNYIEKPKEKDNGQPPLT